MRMLDFLPSVSVSVLDVDLSCVVFGATVFGKELACDVACLLVLLRCAYVRRAMGTLRCP